MAKGPKDPALIKVRDTILRQTMHLHTLVDDLLDIGRITQGKLRLDKAPVDLAAVVREAVETTTPFIERRRHALTIQPPALPVTVDGDAARLVQIVVNLLSNASKYQDEGGRIDVIVGTEDGCGVVRVRDRGIGIAPELIGRIFDRFVQADEAGQRDAGLGLGLAVVKALVDLHGGAVAVRSDGPGQGSEFTVTLPLHAAAHASSPAARRA
jgi:signal transduction histidine kinase